MQGELHTPTSRSGYSVRNNKWHSILFDAFGYSLPRSRDVLKNNHCKMAAKWFRPQLIRFYINDFLHQEGIPAQLVDDNDNTESENPIYDPRVLAGNGIAGNIFGFEYRILKVFKGGLPSPGTPRRKEYYNNIGHMQGFQSPMPGMAIDSSYKYLMKPHLIYLWELNKTKFNLYLAIPKSPLLYADTKLMLLTNPITLIKQKEYDKNTQDINTEVNKTHDIRRESKTGKGV